MNDEFDFANAVRNPFIDSIKKHGYSVTVHYPPPDEKTRPAYEEIIEEEKEEYQIWSI